MDYKYPTPQLLFKAICDTIRAKTGSNNKIIHQNIPDELDNIVLKDYYEEQIENISSIYIGTNLNFSINNNDIITIPGYKFDYSNLTTINLPKCTSIGTEAIANCSNLTTVNLPICTSIGYRAIANCPNLTTVNLPKCTSIGDSAFSSCTSLTTISFPECTSINAFQSCPNLTTVDLPKCTSISGFKGCTSLTTVNFLECTTIGNSAFSSCTSLTTVNLPECTSIGDYAFSNCTNLTTIDLPKCTSIERYAFNSCTSLTTIILSNNQVATLKNISAFNNSATENGSGYIYVPDNLVDSYKSDTNWSNYANRIKPLSELPSNLKEEYGYD